MKSGAVRLEYCDLRELEDTLLSKALWRDFEKRFVNKVTLSAKFGQLADLRNGIRHSRSVEEVTLHWTNEDQNCYMGLPHRAAQSGLDTDNAFGCWDNVH